MKRLVLFVTLAVLLLSAPSFAGVIEESFFRVGGGVMATTADLEEGDFAGIGSGAFLFPIYKNIYGETVYAKMKVEGPDWSNYGGKLIFFAKTPKTKEPNCYAFGTGTFTHDPDGEDEFTTAGYDFGLGVIFPVFGGKWFIEAAKKTTPENNGREKSVWALTAGVMIGLDPGQ